MGRLEKFVLIGILGISLVRAQGSLGVQPIFKGAVGPVFSYYFLQLDDQAFGALKNMHPDFDITNSGNTRQINGKVLSLTGLEGTGEIGRNWWLGMIIAEGGYTSAAQSNDGRINYNVLFKLTQAGFLVEYELKFSSRFQAVLGGMAGLGKATLAANSTKGESWDVIIGGDSLRTAYEVSAWSSVLQPYGGLKIKISRLIGVKITAGWNQQKAPQGKWELYATQKISDSPEVSFSAAFVRFQLYVNL